VKNGRYKVSSHWRNGLKFYSMKKKI
jgi:hypothetical protein